MNGPARTFIIETNVSVDDLLKKITLAEIIAFHGEAALLKALGKEVVNDVAPPTTPTPAL